MEYGPIPEGLCVLHYCDNPPCVNPAHLFLGTDIDNVQDREEKGRGLTAERTFANKLTESEAREIRDLVQQGWVQQDVADAYGVGQVTVSRIFRGESWKRLVTG
jgi:FixJ family two-component response regulator